MQYEIEKTNTISLLAPTAEDEGRWGIFSYHPEEMLKLVGRRQLGTVTFSDEEHEREELASISEEADGIRIYTQTVPIAPLERQRLHNLEVSAKLEVLQSWEGVVTSIDDESNEFTAHLHDLTHPCGNEREVVFDKREVSQNDADLLQIGGIFQWLIGYRRHNFGQMDRVSTIIFRRLPSWHDDDLINARQEGEAIEAAFTVG